MGDSNLNLKERMGNENGGKEVYVHTPGGAGGGLL